MKCPRVHPLLLSTLLLSSLLLHAPAASAQEAAPPKEAPEQVTEAAAQDVTHAVPAAPPFLARPPAATGLRVFVDSETGEITSTPTAEQLERFLRRFEAEKTGRPQPHPVLEIQRAPDGTQGVSTKGMFLSGLRVHRGADGRWQFTCNDPEHEHSTKPPRAAAAEER